MRYLLDANVLVAWGWADHVAHRRAAAWIGSARDGREDTLLTSAIPELGFVRVSVQRTAGAVSVAAAAEVLRGMLDSLGQHHEFLPDDLSSMERFPEWCQSAGRSTDAHLLILAERHGICLATLDEAIPGALVIPEALG
jgi:predicted nucleic acid-binding protein